MEKGQKLTRETTPVAKKIENKKAELNVRAQKAHESLLKYLEKNAEKFQENSVIYYLLPKLIKEGCKLIDFITPFNAEEEMEKDYPYSKCIISAIKGEDIEEINFFYKGDIYALSYNGITQRANLCKRFPMSWEEREPSFSREINEDPDHPYVCGFYLSHKKDKEIICKKQINGVVYEKYHSIKELLNVAQKLKFDSEDVQLMDGSYSQRYQKIKNSEENVGGEN